MTVIALLFAILIGQQGLPLISVVPSKFVNVTPLYPSFAGYNAFELSIMDVTSSTTISSLFTGAVVALTEMNGNMTAALFHDIPSFDACSAVTDDAVSCSVGLGDILSNDALALTGYLVEAEKAAIPLMITIITDVAGDLSSLVSTFDNTIFPMIASILTDAYDSMSFLQEGVDFLESITSAISNFIQEFFGVTEEIIPYIPAIIVFLFQIVAFFGPIIPKLATMLYLSMLLGLFMLIVSLTAIILVIKQLAAQYQWNITFNWNYTVLILYIVTIIFLLASSLMLFTLDLETETTSIDPVDDDDEVSKTHEVVDKHLSDNEEDEEHKPLIPAPVIIKRQDKLSGIV